jgi:hypothetical protein
MKARQMDCIHDVGFSRSHLFHSANIARNDVDVGWALAFGGVASVSAAEVSAQQRSPNKAELARAYG